MSFGRRTIPFGQAGGDEAASSHPLSRKRRATPTASAASSAKPFTRQHGDFLRMLGRDINDADNILPEPEDFDRMIQELLAEQDKRRCAIEADLLARHGVNAIRPFFILAEPVINSPIGAWLIRSMRLMPYEDWNLVYLPTDRATAAVMDLPLHPCQSIAPIDELMVERIGALHVKYNDAIGQVEQLRDLSNFGSAMEQFLDYKDRLRREIIDYVLQVKPMIVELIADVQAKAR